MSEKIIVWSKPSCTQCHMVKRWLEKRGLPYESRELLDDVEKFEEFRQAGFTSAPVVENPIETFAGYRVDILEQVEEHLTKE